VADYTSKYTGAEIDDGIEKARNAPGKGSVLTATLTAAGWSDNQQTVRDEGLAASGYCYMVAPTRDSREAYAQAFVMAEDVNQDGSMTFLCGETPATDLNVQILKIEVS
jgi:hypothetical protein